MKRTVRKKESDKQSGIGEERERERGKRRKNLDIVNTNNSTSVHKGHLQHNDKISMNSLVGYEE